MKTNLLKFCLVVLCAVLGWRNAWAADATLTFSAQGYTNAQNVSSGNIDSYTTWSATDGTNPSAYYNTGSGLRIYSGGSFTVASTKTIASITLTFSSTGYTFSSSNTTTPLTVTPNATSYSWDVSRTCRLQKVEVTYATGGGTSTKYNVNIADDIVNGTVSADFATAAEGATVTLTATPDDGYKFEAWNVVNASTSAAITVTDNKFTMPAANVNVSATFVAIGEEPTPGDDVYVLTDLKDIKKDDVVIITMTNSNGTYAMSNANGTSSAPTAVKVTVSDNKVTVDNSEILWNIDYNNGSFVAYVNGDNSKWLYCTNTNNGVRVGTGSAKTFSINKGYMYEEGTTNARYVGVYNNDDFRCYTSINSNIESQTLAFYVKSTGAPASAEHTLTLVAQDSKSDYYCTFSADKDVIFLASQEAEVQTVFTDGDELLLESLSDESWAMVDGVESTESYGYYVPANTGVIICSSSADVTYYDVKDYEYNQNVSDFSDNMLVAASVAMTGASKFYKLAYDNYDAKSGLGFYWGAENGAAFTCKTGTAYLAVPNNVASNVRGFCFDGGVVTSIKSVENKTGNVIYDLSGRRVNRLQQGVNIVNGKMVIR